MPGDHYVWGTGIEPSLPIQSYLEDLSLIEAAIVFRDAAEVYWRVDSHGKLEREPEVGPQDS